MDAVSHVCQSLRDFIWSCFSTLPRSPVEPTMIALTLNYSNDRAIGLVDAPCGVRADNILVRGLAKFVQLGRPLRFELVLSDSSLYLSPTKINIAADSIAFHTSVDVLLVRKSKSRHNLMLHATLTPEFPQNDTSSIVILSVFVSVTVDLPQDTCVGDEVVISGVSFAGQAVALCVPLRLQVLTGMHAPLQLKISLGAQNTPVITSDGTMFVPKHGTFDVRAFAADGTPLPLLRLADLGVSFDCSCSAAFVDGFGESTGMLLFRLLFSASDGILEKLVAVDVRSKTIRWSTVLGGGDCGGIAVLPAHGVVVSSDYESCKLFIHRLSDGTHLASVDSEFPFYAAADPATSSVYINTSYEVTSYLWDGTALVVDEVLGAVGSTGDCRPLAVVPPAPGSKLGQHSTSPRTSYLVVGTWNSSTLLILSLPDHRLVYTHELEGMKVMGLAADPSGTALAVCDTVAKAIHVLPWPLPGMKLD